MVRQTDRQIDRYIDRQIDRQIDRFSQKIKKWGRGLVGYKDKFFKGVITNNLNLGLV